MRVVFFVHSLISDWNNGHAHFLRGLMTALIRQGHEVLACEPWRNWSSDNLFQDHGAGPIVEFARRFPKLWIEVYSGREQIIAEIDRLTQGADLVIVHEFNEPELVGAVGDIRHRRRDFQLLFHDTHHRTVSVPYQIARLNLAHYDGVLAFGDVLANVYRSRFGIDRVWTFYEAADTSVFFPMDLEKTQDVVWIGNWGDDERSAEIHSYLIDSARALNELRFVVHGVRYPNEAISALHKAGIAYLGWVPNYRVPEVFAHSTMTLHIPRRYYRECLPGIATIRPFEALACGIPLLSLPWHDQEGLFRTGKDYLVVESPKEMRAAMARLAQDSELRERLAEHGLETIRAYHTCEHRAEELVDIYRQLGAVGA